MELQQFQKQKCQARLILSSEKYTTLRKVWHCITKQLKSKEFHPDNIMIGLLKFYQRGDRKLRNLSHNILAVINLKPTNTDNVIQYPNPDLQRED